MFNREYDNFDIKNIFRWDELVLFCQAKCYILGKTCYSAKRNKEKLTALLCYNADKSIL